MKKIAGSLVIVFSTLSVAYVYGQNVGDLAPDFSLATLDENEFTLSQQEGNVVFIFLFGYACPHCIANGPNTQADIYEVYKDNPEFIAVGVDTWDGNSDGVANYQASTEIEYTLCLMGSNLEELYQTTYDRIIVVDKEGIIRYKATANATSSVVDEASNVIDTYLAMEVSNDDEDEVEDEDELEDEEMTVTGISDEETHPTLLFPVPARTRLNIESDLLYRSKFRLIIYDRTGKMILESQTNNLDNGSISLPVENLVDGFYVLKISLPDRIITKKFSVLK